MPGRYRGLGPVRACRHCGEILPSTHGNASSCRDCQLRLKRDGQRRRWAANHNGHRDKQRARHAEWQKLAGPDGRTNGARSKYRRKWGGDGSKLPTGPCEICEETAELVNDHDHETGDKRGKLCQRCNLALGGFRDDPELLQRARPSSLRTHQLKYPRPVPAGLVVAVRQGPLAPAQLAPLGGQLGQELVQAALVLGLVAGLLAGPLLASWAMASVSSPDWDSPRAA